MVVMVVLVSVVILSLTNNVNAQYEAYNNPPSGFPKELWDTFSPEQKCSNYNTWKLMSSKAKRNYLKELKINNPQKPKENTDINIPPHGWTDSKLWFKINPDIRTYYKREWSNMTPECKNRIMQEADDKLNKRDNDNYRTDFTPKELQDKAERLSVRTYGKHFSQLTHEQQGWVTNEIDTKILRDKDYKAGLAKNKAKEELNEERRKNYNKKVEEEGKIYEAQRKAKENSDKSALDEAMISLTRELIDKFAPGHKLIDLKWNISAIRLTTKHKNKIYTLEFTGGAIIAHDLSQLTIDHWSLSNSKSIDVE